MMVALAWLSGNPLDNSCRKEFKSEIKFSAISPFAESERQFSIMAMFMLAVKIVAMMIMMVMMKMGIMMMVMMMMMQQVSNEANGRCAGVSSGPNLLTLAFPT